MAARHISFEIEAADLPLLDELADAFGDGDRSRFLRVAMQDYKERLHKKKRLQEIREGMEILHAEALAERGGKVYTTEETLKLLDELVVP